MTNSPPPEFEKMDAEAKDRMLLDLLASRAAQKPPRPRFDWTINLRDVVMAIALIFSAFSIWQGTLRRIEIVEAQQDASQKRIERMEQQLSGILTAISDISVTIRLQAQRGYDYPPHRHAPGAIVYPGKDGNGNRE